jgi:hypothetical protein
MAKSIFNWAAKLFSKGPYGDRHFRNAGELVDTLADRADNIFFGEPHVNQMSVQTYDFFAQNPEIFTAAKNSGINHLILEFPAILQNELDQYASGRIPESNFIEAIKAFYLGTDENGEASRRMAYMKEDVEEHFFRSLAKTVDNAVTAGLEPHFIDNNWNSLNIANISNPELSDYIKTISEAYEASNKSVSPLQFTYTFIAEMPEEEKQKFMEAEQQERKGDLHRRMNDSKWHALISERIPHNGRMMGIFGYNHLSDNTPCSLPSLLENEGRTSVRVGIFGNDWNRTYALEKIDNMQEQYDLKLQPLEYEINLEEKTFTGKGETFELDNQDTEENQTASASAFSKYSYDR